MSKTRIFLSCGQRNGTEEPTIAGAISKALMALGFDTYVAVRQQSLLALRENLFPLLRDSEYFIFIDFKRDELVGASGDTCRGSLFSHQELAIASFLEKEVIVFQESGVRREGLLDHLQGNPLPFSDRSTLPDLVVQTVKERGWSSDWRNELKLEVNNPAFHDATFSVDPIMRGRFYHLRVTNRNRSRVATDCYAFLASAEDLHTGQRLQFGTAEFKWAGTKLPNIQIGPEQHRLLDAFWVPHVKPTNPQFNTFADSSAFVPSLNGPGDWRLTYGISSGSMPLVMSSFDLHLSLVMSEIRFAATVAA